MPFLRSIRSWSAFVLLSLAAVGPILALCAAAVLDRGPAGGARASVFSVAITALDPFVWTCARNSLIAAGATAFGSMVVGVLVGRLVGDWRYPARPFLLAAMTASAVAHPAIVALGLSILFGTDGRFVAGWRFVPTEWGWYLWLWSALVQGGAVSAFACLAAQRRIDPAWRDAARLAGGARGRVWRKVNWPLLRPAMARAGGLVFVLTLADPGAPLILGLRRTLGYQIIVAGLGDDPFPRIAVLGLIALLACLVVRLILNGWAGPSSSYRISPAAEARPLRAGSWRRSAVGAGCAAVWGGFAGVPLAAVMLESAHRSKADGVSLGVLAGRLLEPSAVSVIVHSVWLGVGVCIVFAVAGRLARALPARGASNRLLAMLHAGAAPPLVMGVAALCLPHLAGLTAKSIDASSGPGVGLLIRNAAVAIASEPVVYLIPIVGVWLAMTPSMLAVWEGGFGVDNARADRISAAVLAGAGWTRAHRLATAWRRTDAIRRIVLTVCLAATNIAPAMLLANRLDDRTLGPGILLFREDPDLGLGPACALAALALAVNVAVVFTCGPGRLGPLDRRKIS